MKKKASSNREGKDQEQHLVCIIELVIHEAGDDAGLANRLVIENTNLYFGRANTGAIDLVTTTPRRTERFVDLRTPLKKLP